MAQSESGKRLKIDSKTMQTILAFASLILLIIIFSVASPNFFKTNNLVGILLATAVNGILAVGITFIIVTGGIDLSIGTVMTFGSVMAGVVVTMWHLPIPLGVLAGVAAGAFCGFVNGISIAKLRYRPSSRPWA